MKKTVDKEKMSFFKLFIKLLPIVFKAIPGYLTLTNVVAVIHGMSFALITIMTQRFFDSVSDVINIGVPVRVAVIAGIGLGAASIGSQILNGFHNFLYTPMLWKGRGILSLAIHEKAAAINAISYEDTDVLDDINKAKHGMHSSIMMVEQVMMIFTFYLPYVLYMSWYLFRLKPILATSMIIVFIPLMAIQIIRSAVFSKLEDEVAPIRREYEYYEKCICDRETFKETYILGAAGFFKELYKSSLKMLNAKDWNAELRTTLMELLMRVLTLIGYFIILYMLIVALIAGEITIGAFAAVFTSIGFMFTIMEEIVCSHVGNMTREIGPVRNFVRFMNLPERKGSIIKIKTDSGVSLKNVSFSYPGAKSKCINEINLEIQPGETIAIVGENGTGKSTLVKIMTGIYLPNEGEVNIGGNSTSKIAPSVIYETISGVFQKYQKYQMTLADNVGISDMESDNEPDKINNSISEADINIDERSFPDGKDTMLSKEFDGVDLSGGQWQRVAIARGFYRDHEMVVLDEPTAAIDPIEETRIYEKFAEISKDKTAVIVTHRLGSAKIADRIIVMNKGCIVEQGNHDELMSVSGVYAKMFHAQAKWYM